MTIDLRGNWNYPTTVRFGAGRISELAEAVKAAGMRNPLFVTDPVVAKMPMTAGRHEDARRRRHAGEALLRRAAQSGRGERRRRRRGLQGGRPRRRRGVRRRLGARCRQADRLHARPDALRCSIFEDVGDWWTRADAGVIAPVVAVPTTAGTGSEVGRAARRHQREDAHQEDHLPSADAAEGDDLRSGTHRRHAADHHRRHRHGRVQPRASKPIACRAITRWPMASRSRACGW